MMQDLTGRVVWITGAGTGIGRAMALAFAEAGCRLALTGRSRETLAETHAPGRGGRRPVHDGARGRGRPAPSDPRASGGRERALGDVQILVNNAGTNARKRYWADLSPADMGARWWT